MIIWFFGMKDISLQHERIPASNQAVCAAL